MQRHQKIHTSILAYCMLALGTAAASDQCGSYAAVLNCAPGDYPTGIDYKVSGPFTLNLDNGVIANNPNADPYAAPDYGAGLAVGGSDDITINMLPGGDSVISGGFYGILAFTDDGSSGNISVNASGNISGESTGIYTVTGSGASGGMSINIGSNAQISGADTAIYAYSQASSSAAPIVVSTAAGSNLLGGAAIVVQDDGGGAVDITTEGDIGRGAATQYGIVAIVYNTGSATVTVNGNIDSLNGGIFVGAGGSNGDIVINTGTNANITTGGDTYFGGGIEAIQADDRFGNPSTGNISITHNGNLLASNAVGIYASISNTAGDGNIIETINGNISSSAQAIYALNAGNGATIINTGSAAIVHSIGADTEAVYVSANNGALIFNNAGDVFSQGINGSAVRLLSSNGAIALNNLSTGRIGASSDSALLTDRATVIDNSGAITGYIMLSAANNTINNNASGIFNLRNFSDSDGNGTRDTQTVSVSAINGTFNNTGTLRLSTVLGAELIDQSGVYTPAGLPIAMLGNGVEQGQLLGVSIFKLAGIITMQDRQTGGSAAVAGDVLVISSGNVAGIPGASAGVFQSNGGSLYLDSVLNAGGADSLSDLLVLDSTALGAGGASSVYIENAGGLGAKTTGDGIKIIDVLSGSSGSATGAFSLGNTRLAAGAYDYRLFRSGLANDDGDWYLRSNLRTAVAAYSALPESLSNYGLAIIGTLHERTGELNPAQGFAKATWARWVYQNLDYASSVFDSTESSSRISAFQAGLDIWQQQSENGSSWQAGLSMAYGNLETHTHDASLEIGALDGNALSYGAYGTWHGTNNSYVDAVFQISNYSNLFVQSDAGDALQTDAQGTSFSLEAGYPFVLQEHLKLEPQAQLIWQKLNIDTAADDFSRIEFSDSSVLLGRFGARLVADWTNADRHAITWLRGNVWHAFDDGNSMIISALDGSSPSNFSGQVAGSWIDIGIGATLNFNASLSLLAEISYYWDIDGPKIDGFNSNLGLKWQW